MSIDDDADEILITMPLDCGARGVPITAADSSGARWQVLTYQCPWTGSIDVTSSEIDRGVTWQCPLCKTWHGKGAQSIV